MRSSAGERTPESTTPPAMVASAALRTGVLFGLLGSLYSGFTTSFYPYEQGERVTHFLAWPHRDSFGALTFGLSAVSLVLLRVLGVPLFGFKVPAPRGGWGRLTWGILSVTFFWGLFGWVYIAVNSFSHPYSLRLQLTHFAQWPHEGTFGLGCFCVSLVSAFAIQLWGAQQKPTRSTS